MNWKVDLDADSVRKINTLANRIIADLNRDDPYVAIEALTVALVAAAKVMERSQEEVVGTLMMNWDGIEPKHLEEGERG